ncbi:MAG TPA: LCP family protein [Nocardioidaceae bacterium]|nr:LCP family protein [Nocardioidaceae bacterium]
MPADSASQRERSAYDRNDDRRSPREDRPPRRERPAKRRRGFGFRLLRALLIFALIIVVAFGALGWFLWSKIDKVDAIPDDPGSASSEGRVYLLVGSDSREELTEEEQDELGTGDVSGRRTDTIMLLHLPSDGRPALISVPRDSMVDIPGHGSGRVNASFAYGGAPLLVETIQNNTGVAIDDYVEIGFGGFAGIVDSLGGVEMCLDDAIQDERANLDLPAGCQTLDGADALGFARARYFDPTSDLGRVERQRELLGSIADKALDFGTLLNPVKLFETATSGGDALIIDEDTGPIDMFQFIRGMGAVTGDGGDTLTVPLGRVGNTVDWDEELAGQLWTSLQEGTGVPDAVLDAQE